MILVDTSIWIDHLRRSDPRLAHLLAEGQVLRHPFVIGEIALGTPSRREMTLRALGRLPAACVATHDEVMSLIERERLFGWGVGYVDVHLIASALLTPEALLWTRDRKLLAVAKRLGLAAEV